MKSIELATDGGPSMRRLVLTGVAVTVVATLTIVGSASASSLRADRAGTQAMASAPVAPRPDKSSAIVAGSTWTLYFYDIFVGGYPFCEVLSFGTSHIFTSDFNDAGKWTGNIALKYSGSAGVFGNRWKYKGKLQTAGTFAGDYTGLMTPAADQGYGSTTFGPFVLAEGNDPLDVGTC
jgi:hypothetical protein